MKRLVLLLCAAYALLAQTMPRERALQEKIVAACCWNESIAFHRSEKAAEMRAELKLLIDQGLSDAVILERFKSKYSARVLIEPQGSASMLIYAVPAVLTILAGAGLVWFIRRWVRTEPQQA
jgi:cytochrome c-type biogenesis protein CcmH/NrfF